MSPRGDGGISSAVPSSRGRREERQEDDGRAKLRGDAPAVGGGPGGVLGPRRRRSSTGTSGGTRSSTTRGPPSSAGSPAGRRTSATTPSTATPSGRAATGRRSSGRARRQADAQILTFRELLSQVNRFAAVLKRRGVGKGDRVLIYLPMVPEALVAVLACARIGAIHSVVFAGFSFESLADRINDCTPQGACLRGREHAQGEGHLTQEDRRPRPGRRAGQGPARDRP